MLYNRFQGVAWAQSSRSRQSSPAPEIIFSLGRVVVKLISERRTSGVVCGDHRPWSLVGRKGFSPLHAWMRFPRLAGRKAMLRWNVGEGFPRCAMRMTRIAITLSNRSPYARPGNDQTARGRSRRNIILSYRWRCIRWRWWLLGWKPGSYLGTHLRSRYQWDGLLSAGCSLAPMPSSSRRFPPPWSPYFGTFRSGTQRPSIFTRHPSPYSHLASRPDCSNWEQVFDI